MRRALALLQALGHHPHGASTAELGRATGLAPATAGRLLATLGDAGFVRRGPSGWVVGDELARVARRHDPHGARARRVRPLLEDLAARGRESAMYAVADPGPTVRVIAQADGPWLLGLTDWVGLDVALHASAAGKLLLADLDDRALDRWIDRVGLPRLTPQTITGRRTLRTELACVRDRGWAELADESEVGLASVAVAVRDHDGAPDGFLGFSGPTARMDRPALVRLLLEAAAPRG